MDDAFAGSISVRNAAESDHPGIIGVMKDWWGGRDLSGMLPRLFLVHFSDTSFVIERKGVLIAFLVGLFSQSRPGEAYICFVGVHPDFRGMGIGTHLYDRFFEICARNGRGIVGSCTSPVNKGSIAFHTRMGFEIEGGNAEIDGVQVTLDYNRPNDPKVLFRKSLIFK